MDLKQISLRCTVCRGRRSIFLISMEINFPH